MKKVGAWQLVLLGMVVLAASCLGSSEEVRTGPVGEDGSSPHEHLCSVARCNAEHEASLAAASFQDGSIEAFANWAACLEAANDAAVAAIEENLDEVLSTHVGQTADDFDTFRQAAAMLCDLLVAASDSPSGSAGTLYSAECFARREQGLSQMIDAWADLGVPAVPVPEAREEYPECYEAFDAALGQMRNGQEEAQASAALGECVEASVIASRDVIAFGIEANGSSDESSTINPSAEVGAALHLNVEIGQSLCELLADASDNGGGTLSYSYIGVCRAEAASQVGALIASFVVDTDPR